MIAAIIDIFYLALAFGLDRVWICNGNRQPWERTTEEHKVPTLRTCKRKGLPLVPVRLGRCQMPVPSVSLGTLTKKKKV